MNYQILIDGLELIERVSTDPVARNLARGHLEWAREGGEFVAVTGKSVSREEYNRLVEESKLPTIARPLGRAALGE